MLQAGFIWLDKYGSGAYLGVLIRCSENLTLKKLIKPHLVSYLAKKSPT